MEMMEENSSVSQIMTYFDIFLLSWEDIWLVEILPKLNLEDLFRFRGTCKTAYELVNIYFSRLKKVDLTDKRSFNLEHYKIVVYNGHSLKYLVLSGSKFLTNESLITTFNTHQNLLTVDLSECHSVTASCLQALAVQCKQLRRLILKDCHWVTRASIEYMAHHQNLLWSINLTGCWELVDQTILQVLTSFRGLKYVSLANIYSLTDQTMRALAGYTSELTALDITGCWRITDQGMNLVTEYCPKLQVLNVTDCRDITEQSLIRLRQKGVKIDRQLNPLYAARLRLEQRIQDQIPPNHPNIRLQV